MAEPPLTPDETSKVSEIRAKEAENAVNIKTQEEEAQKYKSEPAEKTTFKHYRVRNLFDPICLDDIELTNIGLAARFQLWNHMGSGLPGHWCLRLYRGRRCMYFHTLYVSYY